MAASCITGPECGGEAARIETYRPALQRHILRLVKDPGEAEDLTQETLLRAQQNIGRLKDPEALQSWLYRIATNVCYDAIRQRRSTQATTSLSGAADSDVPDLQVADMTGAQPDEVLEQSAMSACMDHMLAALPDAERTVLRMHDEQGFTNVEIGDEMQCTLPNVKIRLHRARARLRKAMEAACDFSEDRRGAVVCDPKRNCP